MTADSTLSSALLNTVTSESITSGTQVEVARIRNKISKELAGMHWYGPYAESDAFHYLSRNNMLDFFDIEVRQVTIVTTEWEHRDISRAVAAVKNA